MQAEKKKNSEDCEENKEEAEAAKADRIVMASS